LGASGQYGRG